MSKKDKEIEKKKYEERRDRTRAYVEKYIEHMKAKGYTKKSFFYSEANFGDYHIVCEKGENAILLVRDRGDWYGGKMLKGEEFPDKNALFTVTKFRENLEDRDELDERTYQSLIETIDKITE
jgi:hypothetical protein